jgi:hypothetical protein
MEFLEFCDQLVALRPRQQLSGNGLERHFALEKRRQPLDSSLLDDRQPDPRCLELRDQFKRPRRIIRQVK